ncbi:MAG TPA: DUF6580 family putative transport protein [Isosphaeraceae bacterium]|nr:DUF6580 family putative transport protein [Isosphaeraceae bacterium]
MLTPITLVVLAVVCRLLTPWLHGWNFVPMGALALYAGSRLPRRWAWAVPVAAMALSDFMLDYGTQRPELTRWVIYATFAATTFLGPISQRPRLRTWSLPLLSLSASTLFFVTSNLATWAEGLLYPLTLPGLAACFVAAIPFYPNTVLADLLGTAVLFGLGPWVERAFRPIHPGAAAASAELGPVDPHQAA